MKVYCIVFGSRIDNCRLLMSSGNSLADGWSALLAEVRIRRPRMPAAIPHAAALVEHGVVIVGAGVPERAVAPIGRWRRRLDGGGVAGPERQRHVRVAHRHLEERCRVRLGIEDRHHVGRVFRRAVELAVGVDRRIAPVRRDQVVHVLVGRRPRPRGDHDVALDALRPLRLGERQFAVGDALGPLAEIFVRHAAELAGQPVGHLLAGLPGLGAPDPCFGMRRHVPNCAGIVRVASCPS